MSRFKAFPWILAAFLAALLTAAAHPTTTICGTSQETPLQTLFLHRQAQRARASRIRPLDVSPLSGNRDIGNIAIIEDAGGVVERQNQFNLDNNSLTFTPTAANATQYQYSVAALGYDAVAAANGSPLVALDDDDARQVNLPFSFPFFGVVYNQVFVNSDGNLTFVVAEYASTERSLGRMTAGPPRIAPLFDDLDPSKTAGGVRVFADQTRVVVSWVGVPEYSQYGTGTPVTFQVWLYPDGRIQFSYNGVSSGIASAVVGIAPGNLQGVTTLVDFRGDPSGNYSGAVAERFGNSLAVDIVTVAQQFYQTHEDSYDYLVIYNNMNIQALGDAVAYENTVRSGGAGYSVAVQDSGQEYGSASRLHSILNMGQLSQYPVDPNAIVPARAQAGDTPLTVLTHETGHLFLAFASIKDPSNPTALPMLGYQLAHWNFAYDSEASVLEGERIVDQGSGVSPRFLTTGTVQGYSPLDQYLMGFRPPSQVPDTFVVTNVMLNGYPVDTSQLHPISGVAFDGTRQNVTIDSVIQTQGRRTPDDTVAQRRYRFAFILVVPQGSQPSTADLSQVDTYRQQFEAFYAKASSGNGVADTSLERSLKLSLFPATGVVAGAGAATATITLRTAPTADLPVQLQSPGGYASFPTSVTVPAGATSASFNYTGLRAGVEEVLAVPGDASYETVAARVQVADASLLKLVAVSGDQQVSTTSAPLPNPIVVGLTDVNSLAYAGARIVGTPSPSGVVTPSEAVTDAQGRASFRWTPGAAASNQLQLAVEAAPSVHLIVSAGRAVPVISAVVNAASFDAGITAGSLATIQGQNLGGGQTAQSPYPWPTTLAGVEVMLDGSAVPLLYVSDTQINFYVPPGVAAGNATVSVVTPSGVADTVTASVAAVQPGIFAGAVLHAGTAISAVTTPVHAGDYIEIYCTGLGATQGSGNLRPSLLTPTVFIGAAPLQPIYSGLAPGFVGLYQVDVQVPPGLTPGLQPVILEVNLQHSNIVNIMLQ
jgi:uncharacterized protein (TIGR03437 family)